MTIYYIGYLLLAIIAVISYKQSHDDKRKKRICIGGFLIWTLIIGLRHPSMGVDLQYGYSNGYLGMFEFIAKQDWKSVFHNSFLNYEKGYVIFNKLLGHISQDEQFLLFTCAFISIAAFTYLIYKYSKFPFLSIIIYLGLPCFLMVFSGLRQALAIAITILSFQFIQKKKPIQFIVVVIIATLFHSSAIIFLLAYPCYYIRTDKSVLKIGSILLLPVVYLLRNPLFSLLSKIFKPDAVADNNSAITLFIIFTLIYIFSLIFEHKHNEIEIGYRNLFYVACICQAYGGVYSTAIRVGYYFMIYLCLLLPEIISQKTNESNTANDLQTKRVASADGFLIYILVFICFAAFGLYSLSKGSWAMTNPYHFFWH